MDENTENLVNENLVNELLQKLRVDISDLVIEARERIEREDARHDAQIRKIHADLFYRKQPIEAEIESITKHLIRSAASQMRPFLVTNDVTDLITSEASRSR